MSDTGSVDDTKCDILFVDGDCAFCAKSVVFFLNREADRRTVDLRFAPLCGPTAARLLSAERLQEVSMVLVKRSGHQITVLLGADAAVDLMQRMTFIWRAVGASLALVPRGIRKYVYRQVAAHRYRIAASTCTIPSEATRRRFLP